MDGPPRGALEDSVRSRSQPRPAGPVPDRAPPPPPFPWCAIEVVGGVTLRMLVAGVVVAGRELLVTGGEGGGAGAVVCAVTIWGVISGGA
jgi:hypothetical protein